MEPIEFAEALNRGEKFLDPESGEIISIYGGADITGDVVGYTDDGRMIKANAKNLELAQIKDTKSDTEKLSEILDDMGIDNLENIVEAIKKGDEEYLIKHKQELIENIGNINIRLSQLPERLRGDIDVMTAAIVNGGVYEMQDLAFVYSQATEELRVNPEFQGVVKEFETFFKEQSKKLDQDRKTANVQAIQKSNERIKVEKTRYTEWLKMYDKASEMLKKGEISFDEWKEMTNDEWKEMTNPISTKQIGQVTKNAPTTTKIRVQEVENTEKENTNEIKGEEGRDDN